MSGVLQIQDLTAADLAVVALAGSEAAAVELRQQGARTWVAKTLDEVGAVVAEHGIDVLLLPFDGREACRRDLTVAIERYDVGVLAVVPMDAELGATRTALLEGALDFVVWPGHSEQLIANALLVANNRRLLRELRDLRQNPRIDLDSIECVGCSPAIRRLQAVLVRAGESDVPVLIEGASGTGKTMCASILHYKGRRSAGELIELDCGTLSVTDLEAGLTRTERGTVLLEDVERLSPDAQARLVRFLKERGDGQSAARILATTSARLAELTARGTFREDLYYRLNVFPICLPTLRERREDVSMLAERFLKQSAAATGLANAGFTPTAMILLESHPWEGNVAQFRNAIFRAHTLAAGGKIDRLHLMTPVDGVEPARGMGVPPTEQINERAQRAHEAEDDEVTEESIRPFQEEEQRLLSRALRATRGNVRRAAQLLGIGRATLYRKIQVYNLRMQ